MPDKRRLQFDFTNDQIERIESLQRKTSAASKAEVVRRSLAIYQLLVDEMSDGRTVVIQQEGERDRVLVLA